MNRTFAHLALLSGLIATLSGCSMLGKGIDYRSASNSRQVSLEIPPELTQPTVDDRYAIPEGRAGSASLSTFNRAGGLPVAAAAGVLPTNVTAQVLRNNETRYISVNADADRAWAVLRDFWTDTGFTLKIENQSAGFMETDWAENRARIPLDPLRATIGRVLDGIYSTSERDKFRTRLERNANGTTEIYVSHRGVQELFISEGKDQTKWQPRPADRDLEMEMINRIVQRFSPASAASPTQTAAGQAPAAPTAQARLTNDGFSLTLTDDLDRAWRRVGLALDRGGFTVEDRDRSKALFYVRYIDTDYDVDSGEKKGWLSSLAFWRSPPKVGDKPTHRVSLAQGAEGTLINVQRPTGEADTSPTAKRILTVLSDQLK